MDMEKYTPGTFSWVDLSTKDKDKATAFYTALFGWNAKDQTDPDGNYVYTMFDQDGKSVAGMGVLQEDMIKAGMPSVWNNYVTTDDVDATTKKVESAGGKVVLPKMEVFDDGVMAIYSDDQGAVFSVWQPKKHIGAERVNDVGCFCWNELLTPDIDKAGSFYKDVFGWAFKLQEGRPYSVIENDGNMNGGAMKLEGEMAKNTPPCWMTYFVVGNLDKACAKVKELGGAVHMPEPIDAPGVGKFTVVTDDQNAHFYLMEMANNAG